MKRHKQLVFCGILVGAILLVYYGVLSSSFSSSQAINRDTLISNSSARDNKKEELGHLSATYADLDGPLLRWEKMQSAPVPRLDGAAVQIRDLLYVFNGYGSIDTVHSAVDVFNFTSNAWVERFDAPEEMAHSHLGMATDGRYVYAVSGQYGAQCRASVPRVFSLDTATREWRRLPDLPAPRYAPATQLWRGRLHVMGGSMEDRHTVAVDHWSLPVGDGRAAAAAWVDEIPVPRGGPHRACVVAGDRLFVIGGQEGDFMAKPGSPIFKCSRRHELVYSDVYALLLLDGATRWHVLPSMPKPVSHIEFAWILLDRSIIIVGGTTERHPVSKKMTLIGEVFRFHLDSLKWSVLGRLPFRVKTALAGAWNGSLYFTSGQRDRGPRDPSPKKVIGEMWRTRLPPFHY